MASRKTDQEAAKIMGEYRNIEEKFAQKLYAKYVSSGNKMDYKSFKMMITNPSSLKDKAVSEAIWESVPADELMGMKDVGIFAHKAVQELSNYNDVDGFQRYLSALRILTINRNPAVLEIM
ncbi:MAG: hypothetical protein EHM20_07420 [Alphaproteobacteria bacterium]|nr:MAG: hypothetical protein EHM20_07420 [Alphaproteobacteria bacterium]